MALGSLGEVPLSGELQLGASRGLGRDLHRDTRSWRNTDITGLADAIRGLDEPVIDLVDMFGVPAHPELQGPDGVHPSLAGQQRIVTALVETLAG